MPGVDDLGVKLDAHRSKRLKRLECNVGEKTLRTWLEANGEATKEVYDEQKKKAEEDFRPFFIKLYEGMGGENKMTPEQMAAAAAEATPQPKTEEVY